MDHPIACTLAPGEYGDRTAQLTALQVAALAAAPGDGSATRLAL